MSIDYWKRGEWNAICDRCGFQYKSGDLRREWDGLMVCRSCWEPRHPQDFIKAIPEKVIPWSRPDTQMPQPPTVEQFMDGNFCDETWLG